MPQTGTEKTPKRRIAHIMDMKRPRILVLVLGAAVCVALGVLLLANPGRRGNQLEGVEMSVVRALDRGVPVDLPKNLARDLVPLIRTYDRGDYSDLSSYRPAAGDIYLSDQFGGTVFYLTRTLDRGPVLVRINHDGYGRTSAYEGLTLDGLEEDAAYRVWTAQLEDYLTTGRADALYDLKTPYIGNHVDCGAILNALNVSDVAGPCTLELQTEKAPYGLTLHLERLPDLQSRENYNDRYLSQVGILFSALVDNAAFFHWDYVVTRPDGSSVTTPGGGVQPGLRKPVDRAAFQTLYDGYRTALGGLEGTLTADPTRYSLGDAVYLSPEMPWRELMGYFGTVTIAPDVFSVQMSHYLSSAWPQTENTLEPSYERGETPDEIPTDDGNAIDLTEYAKRSVVTVRDWQGADTGYRIYDLDGELWLSSESGGAARWVFRLTDQPGLPLPTDEEE